VATIEPIFAESRQALLRRLRLSNVSDEGAEAAIDAGLQKVRVGMYDKLGKGLIDTILSTGLVDNPSTADEVRRVKAAVAEETWLRHELMRTMKTFFIDGGSGARQFYHEQAFDGGDGDDSRYHRELSTLWADLLEMLDELRGNPDESSVRATAFENPNGVRKPLESILDGTGVIS